MCLPLLISLPQAAAWAGAGGEPRELQPELSMDLVRAGCHLTLPSPGPPPSQALSHPAILGLSVAGLGFPAFSSANAFSNSELVQSSLMVLGGGAGGARAGSPAPQAPTPRAPQPSRAPHPQGPRPGSPPQARA